MKHTPTRIVVPSALAALFLVATLAACGEAEGQEDGEDTPTPAVEAVQARYGALPLSERLTGTVRATGQVAIYPEASGPVVAVMADDGDYVRRGEALVQIRAQASQAQLAQARANLSAAEAQAQQARASVAELRGQLRRTEVLAEDSLVSIEALETQQAQVQGAEASLAQAQAQVAQAQATISEREEMLGRTVVRAPLSGTVGQRNVEVGMQVSGTTRLFVIGNLETLQVNVSLTEEMLGYVEEGQAAVISSNTLSDSASVRGIVESISPFLNPETYTTTAEIAVENERGSLQPGMFVAVDILYGESQQATLVPTSALYDDPASGRQGIYVASSLDLEVDPVLPEEGDEPAPMVGPTPVTFEEVEVLAEGRMTAGVRGIDDGAWVVVVGQNLLQEATGETVEANVRPVAWEHIIDLQGLQRRDLLRQFMEKQQRMARTQADSSQAAARLRPAAAPPAIPAPAAQPPTVRASASAG